MRLLVLKTFWRMILFFEMTIVILQIKIARLLKKRVLLVAGIPIHSNLGDQAIAMAEIKFLKKKTKNSKVIYLNLIGGGLFSKSLKIVKKQIMPTDIIFGHGGGNMGDQYPEEEFARRTIIEAFPNNKIIIFPQTIFFNNTGRARKILKDTIKCYASHGDLTLIAREKESYKLMKKYFKTNEVLLMPDIVLSMPNFVRKIKRSGAMTCLRADVEKTANVDDQQIINLLQKKFHKVNVSDTMSKHRIILANWHRMVLLRYKWREFSQVEVVVTDRLHGMVFAALTRTPCVVFSNYNHKVSGTYEWIKRAQFIKFCYNIGSLELKINQAITAPRDFLGLNDEWQKLERILG